LTSFEIIKDLWWSWYPRAFKNDQPKLKTQRDGFSCRIKTSGPAVRLAVSLLNHLSLKWNINRLRKRKLWKCHLASN